MVHNGIEYGDMQLICEAYHLMKDVLGLGHEEMAKVRWHEEVARGGAGVLCVCWGAGGGDMSDN